MNKDGKSRSLALRCHKLMNVSKVQYAYLLKSLVYDSENVATDAVLDALSIGNLQIEKL